MFEIGDVVECKYYGKGKVVEKLESKPTPFPLIVEFDLGRFQYTTDGRFFESEETPALTLIERPASA